MRHPRIPLLARLLPTGRPSRSLSERVTSEHRPARTLRHPRVALLALLLVASVIAPQLAGAQTAEQGAALARAVDLAQAGDWTEATSIASRAGGPVAADVVRWLQLREGRGDWPTYRDFLARNPDWPGGAVLWRHAERAMLAELPAADVLGVFADRPPSTGSGALRLADALMATGHAATAQDLLRRAWREMSMTAAEQVAILESYGSMVAGEHVARLDTLLWRGRTDEAAAMLPLVPPDWRALAAARIAVRTDAPGSTAAIRAVPATLADDPGLAYERYLYRVAAGRWEDAESLLRARSTEAGALGRPDLWMERRANLARAALRRGEVAAAYDLAAHNFGTETSGADYADAEWVAGYVALTRMNDPARAAEHFRRFGAAVSTPVSLGRAGYWLGRAEDQAGNPAAAEAAFAAAARHQTSFYGQLAAERIGADPDPRLAGEAASPHWRDQPFVDTPIVQAARLLALAGDDARASLFLRQAAAAMDAPSRAALAQMALDSGLPHVGVRLAKDAAAQGMLLPNQGYPLHDLTRADPPVAPEFALAIARQESEFNPRAISPAGARGLMQLMPGTARDVATDLGVDFGLERLTGDPLYNARLGTGYLAQMADRYAGSYVLAAAAYNAGPGRVDGWIAAYGDPRRAEVDPVEWIETIPFEETRNYVMRVLEGLHVYRARLNGAPPPLRLAADIERTG